MHLLWFAVATVCILQASGFATTIYLHRSVTHRGLALHPVVAFFFHLELLLFTGVSPREWAAVHRKHHHFSDREGDPHSPVLRGVWTILFGNYWFYRRETKNPATLAKYTPDYQPDLLDRIPGASFGFLLGWGLLVLLLGWGWGTAAFVTHVVAYILVNAMVNSLGHAIGYRNYDNQATNLRWLAWITGGEGLHNNHHEYPTAARFSMRPHEFDPAWPVIRLLERLGLAQVRPEPLAKVA
jgi:stearoyl-CoA desaturase (Delta-9 desaturase)